MSKAGQSFEPQNAGTLLTGVSVEDSEDSAPGLLKNGSLDMNVFAMERKSMDSSLADICPKYLPNVDCSFLFSGRGAGLCLLLKSQISLCCVTLLGSL